MPPFQQPEVQLSNAFAALDLGSDPSTSSNQQQPAAGHGPPPAAAGYAAGGGPYSSFVPPFMQQPQFQQQQQQQQEPAPATVPADVCAACSSRRPLEELLLQPDASMLSQHERRTVLAYLRAELLDGYAGQYK
jgi:hypothetical protein